MNKIRLILAHLSLATVYGVTWLLAVMGRALPRRSWEPTGRIAVTGTIYNPNWYLSHITPLTRSGVKEVILIIDGPLQPMEGVRFACPPRWLQKLISRAGAKALWMLGVGIRYRPDLFMGYNLVAGGCTALAAGAILGRPACYQMTGGQAVLSMVGFDAFDFQKVAPIWRRLLKVIERLAVGVIRKFDLIVVRGNKGKTFLAQHGIKRNVAIITGSVRMGVTSPRERKIDIVFVGRLEPIKQVHQFLEIVHAVSHTIPTIKAAIAGDGCLMEDMKARAAQLGVSDHLDFLGKRKDVEEILASSRIFVLTSKSEGLSIAMIEAMANGAVPVVANVGELGDIAIDGVSGYLIPPDQVTEYVDRILRLLSDASLWAKHSQAAMDTARGQCSLDVVAEKWSQSIKEVVASASGRNRSCA